MREDALYEMYIIKNAIFAASEKIFAPPEILTWLRVWHLILFVMMHASFISFILYIRLTLV